MFIFGILMHEIGHYLGGKISGYSFLYIEIFGITLEKKKDAYRIKRYRNMPVGQCVMFHENVKKSPVLLVAGGILMNLSILILSVFVFFISGSFWIKTVCIIEVVVQGSLIYMNVFGSSTSDGRTLVDIHKSDRGPEYYNRLLLIAKYLHEGKKYADMDDVFFYESGDESVKSNKNILESKNFLEEEYFMYYRAYLKEGKCKKQNK